MIRLNDRYKVKGDKVIWIIYILFMIISLIEVFSSMGKTVYDKQGGDVALMFFKHFMILIFGLGTCYIAHLVNYIHYKRIIKILFWFSIGILIFTLILGYIFHMKTASRWIILPIIGQFQPSEIVKYIIILYTAKTLTDNQEKIKERDTFIKILIPILVICALIFPENFSTAALIFLVCFIMMFVGRVSTKYCTLLVLIAVGGLLLMFLIFNNNTKLIERSQTWNNRIEEYQNNDKTEINQTNLALMAISTGGLSGKFIGNTVQARFLSESHNDFIFAIMLEEGGIWLCLIIIILYLILIYRTIRISKNAKEQFGSLTSIGIALMFTLQAIVNMMVATNIIPVTGQTLPFISYGGTSFVFSSYALGIILNISKQKNQRGKEDEIEGIEVDNNGNELEQENNKENKEEIENESNN
jgi:cell division protein FtsW